MKKFLLILSIILSCQTANSKDWAAIQIFACEPEWGSLAQEIVGDKAKVVVAITQFQNPHSVQARASMVADVRKADIIFCSGADLESGWLPELLQKASKKEIQVGGSGYFMASDYVQKLEISPQDQKSDRLKSYAHPFGNPHIHLNPHNIPPIANELLKRMVAADPANAHTYQKNYDQFIDKWNLAIVKWEAKAKNLKNMPIIVKHDQWAYLIDWLGLKVVARLEEKPGVEPNIKYLFTVLEMVKNNPAEMIIYAPFEDRESVLWLSEKAATKASLLPFTIYGTPKAKNLFTLFDETLNILVRQSENNNHLPSKSVINTQNTNKPN